MKTYEVSEADLRLWRDLIKVEQDLNDDRGVIPNFVKCEIDKYLEADDEQTDAD